MLQDAETNLTLYRPSHMKHLYSVCRAGTKIWRDFPNGDHNSSVAEEGYFDAIAEFIMQQIVHKG